MMMRAAIFEKPGIDNVKVLDNVEKPRLTNPDEVLIKVKHVSIFLMIIAVLFYFQWLSQDIPAILAYDAPQDVKEIDIPTNPVHVLDLGLFLPAMIITSILLWKKRAMRYLFAAPLLIFSILTGAGILFANNLIRLEGASVSYIPGV
ncbi:MAG: hypothetical protein ICV56_01450 [Nitrososphaeraceae archaeon]|nr:hypothetical protein [Nitrososphaeraceae archaeon]